MNSIISSHTKIQLQYAQQISSVRLLFDYCFTPVIHSYLQLNLYVSHNHRTKIKYLKYYQYMFISASVDAISFAFTSDLRLKHDVALERINEEVKSDLAISIFNENQTISNLPEFEPMHIQDVNLFQSIENEAKYGSICLFKNTEQRVALANIILKMYAEANLDEDIMYLRNQLTNLFNTYFQCKNAQAVDLSFFHTLASVKNNADQYLAHDFNTFMNSVPSTVYNCHNKDHMYKERNILIDCYCGQRHALNECEAICDGG